MNIQSIGLLLLGIWLILISMPKFIPTASFSGFGIITAILAIVCGIFIIVEEVKK